MDKTGKIAAGRKEDKGVPYSYLDSVETKKAEGAAFMNALNLPIMDRSVGADLLQGEELQKEKNRRELARQIEEEMSALIGPLKEEAKKKALRGKDRDASFDKALGELSTAFFASVGETDYPELLKKREILQERMLNFCRAEQNVSRLVNKTFRGIVTTAAEKAIEEKDKQAGSAVPLVGSQPKLTSPVEPAAPSTPGTPKNPEPPKSANEIAEEREQQKIEELENKFGKRPIYIDDKGDIYRVMPYTFDLGKGTFRVFIVNRITGKERSARWSEEKLDSLLQDKTLWVESSEEEKTDRKEFEESRKKIVFEKFPGLVEKWKAGQIEKKTDKKKTGKLFEVIVDQLNLLENTDVREEANKILENAKKEIAESGKGEVSAEASETPKSQAMIRDILDRKEAVIKKIESGVFEHIKKPEELYVFPHRDHVQDIKELPEKEQELVFKARRRANREIDEAFKKHNEEKKRKSTKDPEEYVKTAGAKEPVEYELGKEGELHGEEKKEVEKLPELGKEGELLEVGKVAETGEKKKDGEDREKERKEKLKKIEGELIQARKDYLETDYKKKSAYGKLKNFFGTLFMDDRHERLGEEDPDVAYYKKEYDKKLLEHKTFLLEEAVGKGIAGEKLGEKLKTIVLEENIALEDTEVEVRVENFEGRYAGFVKECVQDLNGRWEKMHWAEKTGVVVSVLGMASIAVGTGGAAAIGIGAAMLKNVIKSGKIPQFFEKTKKAVAEYYNHTLPVIDLENNLKLDPRIQESNQELAGLNEQIPKVKEVAELDKLVKRKQFLENQKDLLSYINNVVSIRSYIAGKNKNEWDGIAKKPIGKLLKTGRGTKTAQNEGSLEGRISRIYDNLKEVEGFKGKLDPLNEKETVDDWVRRLARIVRKGEISRI